MITNTRSELLAIMAQLSKLYPPMRFGQLVCMATSLVGDSRPAYIDEPEDEALVSVTRGHMSRRATQVGLSEVTSDLSDLPPGRAELLRVLEEMGSQYPKWPLGRLVFKLAVLAHVNVYDIEDEQLLEAARSTAPGLGWFRWYTDKLEQESTIRPRHQEPSYRCPCCHHRTLYERGGFEICPVCYWEDDGQDNEAAETVRGGPNGDLSLTHARQNYLVHKVCDPRFVAHVRPPRPAEL